MRITDIRIKNYRAFYGEHHFELDRDGKNLMLYGENGSGKSSLFTALKDFFLSSDEKLKEVEENIFVPASQKNTASIKITLRESAESSKNIDFELNSIQKEIISTDKVVISAANKIKGFFDYRNLLKTHINHEQQVDLFKIIVHEILYHSVNRFSNKEIGKEWDAIYEDTHDKKQTTRLKEATKNYLKDKFNPGLIEILQSIEQDTNTFLKYFGINVNIKLDFDKVEYLGRRGLSGNKTSLNIDFYKQHIPKHQNFLNEARLTALAISLYLASIKINPTKGVLKILVLDDLLIGLDMSNRLPLLDIIKDHFVEVKTDDRFQIIMTTYDKVWYELVKSYFGPEQWKFVEVYSRCLHDEDFEIPIIKHDNGYLPLAKKHLAEKDFKASAVYIRTEFERLVKTICDKQRIPVSYRKNQKEVTSDDFWNAIELQTDLDPDLIKQIKIHRGVVMNPFSHYDLEKPEFEKELRDTITSVERLSKVPIKNLKKRTYSDLLKEISRLELQLKKPIISKIISALIDKSK
ncbi:AAA family ATPase [Adhaeribacter rhizoryzae]|uniref:AAA family ATPase n=1 Tax=Adhaeribacter rhizoryzae TaxID=2607907 RepID=A0A5M6DKX1_9BACT|nr:ATP-binding protein [Adhaeribacter rhizoryzae]KAA5548093.1 AAA family ATPase [Adhaeribacter rhizoryzae]